MKYLFAVITILSQYAFAAPVTCTRGDFSLVTSSDLSSAVFSYKGKPVSYGGTMGCAVSNDAQELRCYSNVMEGYSATITRTGFFTLAAQIEGPEELVMGNFPCYEH